MKTFEKDKMPPGNNILMQNIFSLYFCTSIQAKKYLKILLCSLNILILCTYDLKNLGQVCRS